MNDVFATIAFMEKAMHKYRNSHQLIDKTVIEIIKELIKKIMDILLQKNLICLIYTECIFQLCKKKDL